MRYLLSRSSQSMLAQLAKERTLCAFDFDGTLAPIVDHPDVAAMRARTRALLAQVGALYPCAILSGRARADVVSKLDGVRVESVIGNHGAEARGNGLNRARVEGWRQAIEGRIDSLPGVWVEDKGLSLAVHYRQSERKAEARRRVMSAASHLQGVRVFGGKQVVNLVIPEAPNKGQALAKERDRLKADWVLFVGDDENDEDGFALEGNTIAVRVGRAKRSHAEFFLKSQGEIDRLLEILVALRAPD